MKKLLSIALAISTLVFTANVANVHEQKSSNGFIELDELEAFLERDYYDYGASEGRTLSAKELDRLKFQIKIKAYGTHGEDLYQLFQKWDKDDSGTMSKRRQRDIVCGV